MMVGLGSVDGGVQVILVERERKRIISLVVTVVAEADFGDDFTLIGIL